MNRRHDDRAPRYVFMVLAMLVGAWLTWDAATYRLITYSLWADYWEHSAALTAWLGDLTNPGNPHLADGSSSARYVPLFYLLALLGNALGLDAIDLMALSAIINVVLLVVGIRLFFDMYFRNPWAPAVGLVVLLCGWGVPWIWSNLYELRSLFMTASYPSTFVFGLSMITFWLVLSFIRGRTGFFISLFAMLLLSALMFLSHPLTGVFAIGAGCLLALTEKDAPFSLRVLIILMLIGGSLLAALWPWFSVWDVILASSAEVDDRTWQAFGGMESLLERARSGIWWHMLYNPREVATALGPALLGIPLAAWLLLRRQFIFIPLGAAMMAVPYVANVFVQVALAHRFLFYIVFFLHMAIVWGILELFDRWRSERLNNAPTRTVTVAVSVTRVLVALAVIGHVALLWGDYRGLHLKHTLEIIEKRRDLPADYTVPRLYRELTANIPDTAVVIGHARLTWPLPTFRGKTVALPENHENSLVVDQFARADAVRQFLAGGTSAAERENILRAYNATHVLLNQRDTDATLMIWLQSRSSVVATVGWYQMLELQP